MAISRHMLDHQKAVYKMCEQKKNVSSHLRLFAVLLKLSDTVGKCQINILLSTCYVQLFSISSWSGSEAYTCTTFWEYL